MVFGLWVRLILFNVGSWGDMTGDLKKSMVG
jgi:hypothetical protein